MKSKIIQLAIAMSFGVTGFIQGQTVTNYKPVAVHYVSLAENSSVTAKPIQTKALNIKSSNTSEASIEIKLDEIIHSNLSGIGGAFNEQGGEAFIRLSPVQQKKLAADLFNAEKGIGFSMCRTAVGSSDFGLGAYSYSETAEDYDMKHLTRDTSLLKHSHILISFYMKQAEVNYCTISQCLFQWNQS